MCCHQQLVCFNFQCPGTFLLEQKYLYPKKHIGCIMYNLYIAIGSEVEAATSFVTCADDINVMPFTTPLSAHIAEW